MNVLQRGDRLVVSELSRLGRSLGQISSSLPSSRGPLNAAAKRSRKTSRI